MIAAAVLRDIPRPICAAGLPLRRVVADQAPATCDPCEVRLRLAADAGAPSPALQALAKTAYLVPELRTPADTGALPAWKPYIVGVRLLPPEGEHDPIASMLDAAEAIGALGIPLLVQLLPRELRTLLSGLARLDRRHGHVAGAIVEAAGCAAPELRRRVALARAELPAEVRVLAGCSITPDQMPKLIDAGLDDLDHWGAGAAGAAGAADAAATHAPLLRRLPVLPRHAREARRWLSVPLAARVLAAIDAGGLLRDTDWHAGTTAMPPPRGQASAPVKTGLAQRLRLLTQGRADALGVDEIAQLFAARDAEADAICAAADALRAQTVGDTVSYVVNRNINYTNICSFRCRFCAFAKGGRRSSRDPAYLLNFDDIAGRVREARLRGGTEVCLQGGIHPQFDGHTYEAICAAVHAAEPEIHIHAFSPLEIRHGAQSLDLDLDSYLRRLQRAGLRSLPGTAAEILVDEVRKLICPDKLSTREWTEVMEAASRVGLRATATIMFGHVETYRDCAEHLLLIRDIQHRSGVFTEFVPLPFVAAEAPMFLHGQSRGGPTWREALLMHAIARLVLHPHIPNIQASWVKLGPLGAQRALQAGANDLGGVLMDESITRAAGASHGRQMSAAALRALIASIGRPARQRDTFYRTVAPAQASIAAVA